MSNITVNAVGDQCPMPVVKTIKTIGAMTEPGTVEVHVDNEIAVQNLEKYARGKGLSVASEKLDRQHYVVKITVAEILAEAEAVAAQSQVEPEPDCIPDQRGNTVIVIASDCMGNGDDKLGATLMKGFIYAVSEQDQLPSIMLFYNGGAKLTAEGSACIEDLKSLEARGVEILTCGACANYYGLEGKQAVGTGPICMISWTK